MRAPAIVADAVVLRPAGGGGGGGFRQLPLPFKLLNSCSIPTFFNRGCPSVGWPKNGIPLQSLRARNLKVRAMENSGENQKPIGPLHLESPTGQLLSEIIQTHPHLLPAAIDQQLERLQLEKDAQKKETPPTSQELPLQRRIAEVKEKERQTELAEIIYCLIVQKFMEHEISMIPALQSSTDPRGLVDSWPNQEQKLQAVHSSDALEMIQSHLTLVLGDRAVGPLNTIAQISKLKLGKLYAASIMYGYFLKRVDRRYQLERTMKTLSKGSEQQRNFEDLKPNPFWDLESMVQISSDDDNSDGEESNGSRLKSYVMYLDAETLQRYATIRSKESISLIEKQTQSLFGRPDIRVSQDGSLDALNDEVVGITFSGLTMLVLEAVAFGSFLWDAEEYVESKYHFVSS